MSDLLQILEDPIFFTLLIDIPPIRDYFNGRKDRSFFTSWEYGLAENHIANVTLLKNAC